MARQGLEGRKRSSAVLPQHEMISATASNTSENVVLWIGYFGDFMNNEVALNSIMRHHEAQKSQEAKLPEGKFEELVVEFFRRYLSKDGSSLYYIPEFARAVNQWKQENQAEVSQISSELVDTFLLVRKLMRDYLTVMQPDFNQDVLEMSDQDIEKLSSEILAETDWSPNYLSLLKAKIKKAANRLGL